MRLRSQSALRIEKQKALHDLVPTSSPASPICLLSPATLIFQQHKQHKLSLTLRSSPFFAWLVHFHPLISTQMLLPREAFPEPFIYFATARTPPLHPHHYLLLNFTCFCHSTHCVTYFLFQLLIAYLPLGQDYICFVSRCITRKFNSA